VLLPDAADHGKGGGPAPSDRSAMRLTLGVGLIAGAMVVATAIWPSMDVFVARLVFRPQPLAEWLATIRPVLRFLPLVLCAGLMTLAFLRWRRGRIQRPEMIRSVVFLAATMALGPGLLVNVVLKDHSHRPRPVHTSEVAGVGLPFRPFTSFDGGCARNCSFSSGETASAFWTVAPALLTPPALRLTAVAAALAFGVGVGASRMTLGAHYLSDVAFSALAMLLIVVSAWKALYRRAGKPLEAPERETQEDVRRISG
jgi:lipid A 4'-phosphatase